MRLKLADLISVSLLFIPFFAQAKEAGNCGIKMVHGSAPASEANQAKDALEKRVDTKFKDDQKVAALYFVFPAASGKSEEIVSLKIPADASSDRVDVPTSLALKLSTSGPVQIFNRTAHREEGMAGSQLYSSLYFLPRSVKELGGTKVRTDFDGPITTHISPGCNVANFKGLEKLSIVYGNISKYADEITAFNAKKKLNASEEQVYAESVGILNKKLDVKAGRSPASTDTPVVADDRDIKHERRNSKKLPLTPIGGNKAVEKKTKTKTGGIGD